MKKLITLIFAMALFVGVKAQFATEVLTGDQTYASYTTDVTLEDATAQYWYIDAPKKYFTAQWVFVDMDTVNSTHSNVAVQLQGRYSANDAWANIGSAVNWKLTTDTTFEILNTTENGYRHFKLLFTPTGAGGEVTIDKLEFKQWFGNP